LIASGQRETAARNAPDDVEVRQNIFHFPRICHRGFSVTFVNFDVPSIQTVLKFHVRMYSQWPKAWLGSRMIVGQTNVSRVRSPLPSMGRGLS